jgi:CelD/BcsL family acetyltransferase involved in cellulose biosynthesis
VVQVEIHRGPFEDLLADWGELFAADDDATPFSSPEWARAWWEIWGGTVDAWIPLAQNGSGLQGLAPLAISQHGPIRVLRPLTRDLGDYWDVLARPGERAAVCAAIAREIARRRDEWDVLVLHGLRPSIPIGGALARAGLRVHSRPPEACPTIDLPETFDEYVRSLPPKRRTDLRRHLRRLDEGEVTLREVRDEGELRGAIGRGHELRKRQWRARGKELDELQRGELFREFLSAVARHLVPAGLLHVWEFRHRDEPAGVYVNLVDRDVLHGYFGCFDPDLSRLGIGKIALAQAIRSSIGAGRRSFDLGAGTDEYKYSYGAHDQPVGVLVAGNGSARSRAGSLAVRTVRTVRVRRAA